MHSCMRNESWIHTQFFSKFLPAQFPWIWCKCLLRNYIHSKIFNLTKYREVLVKYSLFITHYSKGAPPMVHFNLSFFKYISLGLAWCGESMCRQKRGVLKIAKSFYWQNQVNDISMLVQCVLVLYLPSIQANGNDSQVFAVLLGFIAGYR